MKKGIIVVFVLLVILYGNTTRLPLVNVLSDKGSTTTIEFKVDNYDVESVELKDAICTRIIIPGCPTYFEKGYPELPFINKSVIISDDGLMLYKILEIEQETKQMETIVPSKGNLYRNVNPEDIPYTFDKVYEISRFWPEEVIQLGEPFILRDFRGISIRFNPFQYNPITKELRITKRIVVEIYEASKGGKNIFSRERKGINQEFLPTYKNIFLNFDKTRYNSISEQPGKMLIITADAYNANLQPFVRWKKRKGIYTKVVNISSIGNSSTAIKNRIQAEYDSTNLVWVLLVGDGNEVRPGVGTIGEANGADADPVYAYTAGSDYYPDIFISRFSSRNGNAENIDKQISRSIGYERAPQMNADWYNIGFGVASNQNGGTPYEDSTRMNWLRDSLLDYNYTVVNKSYDPWGTSTIIKNYIEAGTSVINYIGHGSVSGWLNGGGFYINNINSLNNPWKLPFVISVACVVGNFNGNDCYCEASVTAGSVSQPNGFLAHWGSTINQSWVPPCIGQEGAINLLTHNQKNTFGGICFNGVCYMIDYYGATNPDGIEMAQTWHIFGDGSVQLRTNTPDSMLVVHSQNVPTTPNDFAILVKDNDGITPLKDALVCLWIPGQDPELYKIGYTDSTGNVTFNIAPIDSGDTMWITATRYNYIPYEGYAIVGNTEIRETQNYEIENPQIVLAPNPFSGNLTIEFAIRNPQSEISLKVYDATGRVVKQFNHLSANHPPRNLADGGIQPFNQVVWYGDDDSGRLLPAGVYFIRFEAGDYKQVEKAILLR
ncbi:MAG: C25 family cysteine peptidase [bacterium]